MVSKLLANYHTHTKRCLHAVGEDREYVEKAIEQGFQILGFSDHVPWPYKTDFVSTVRMTMNELSNYVESVLRLKEEYKKDIEIYLGFETEYLPYLYQDLKDKIADIPYDYMLLGQHFLFSEENGIYMGAPFTDEKTLSDYVDTIIEGIQTGDFLYVAHPDIPNYIGAKSIYRTHMTRLCQAVKERNIPLEINVVGLRKNRNYPCSRFFEIASEIGNDVVIGVDAHDPLHFASEDIFVDCINIAKRYQLNLLHSIPMNK